MLQVSTQYNTKIAKQYSDYLELKESFQNIKRFSKYYTEKYKFKEFFQNTSTTRFFEDYEIIPMQSIAIAIIIMYAKCFDENPKRRNIKLKSDFLKGCDKEILGTHEHLISIRHNFLAHAGNSEFESHEVLIGFNQAGETAISASPKNYIMLTGETVEQESLDPLIDEILSRIDIKLRKIEEKITEEVDLMFFDRDNIINKINNNIPIKDSDIEQCRKLAK